MGRTRLFSRLKQLPNGTPSPAKKRSTARLSPCPAGDSPLAAQSPDAGIDTAGQGTPARFRVKHRAFTGVIKRALTHINPVETSRHKDTLRRLRRSHAGHALNSRVLGGCCAREISLSTPRPQERTHPTPLDAPSPNPGSYDRTDTKVLEEAPLLQQTPCSTTTCSTTLGRKLCGPIGRIATKHFEPAVADMGGPRTMDRRRP